MVLVVVLVVVHCLLFVARCLSTVHRPRLYFYSLSVVKIKVEERPLIKQKAKAGMMEAAGKGAVSLFYRRPFSVVFVVSQREAKALAEDDGRRRM